MSFTAYSEALLVTVGPAIERVQPRVLQPLAACDRPIVVRLMTEIAATHNDMTSAPLRLD